MENRTCYSIENMCRCLGVGVSSFYCWEHRKSFRAEKEQIVLDLKQRIQLIFTASKSRYGSPKIRECLAQQGIFLSRSYVGVLMSDMGLRSKLPKPYKNCTDSTHGEKTAPHILDRNFTTDILGSVWVSDITYIPINKKKFVYLTTVIDLADRAVVGWSLSEDMTQEKTVLKAYTNAKNYRETNSENFIFHSDQGSQYAAISTKKIFENAPKMKQSMSRKGNCWDNAVAEAFFKAIKYEELNDYKFKSIQQVNQVVTEYIHWYNNYRIHQSLGYLTPKQKEQQLIQNNNYKFVA